ncbi:protein zer-1 homolog [Argiope bruennichi]|uniref:protein zer-1 homolog n=1 Tax=Argiope bruennichi TaxID=94029 RepID=UPI0024955112|nr:protein zer-1 homolog [Argiope bruennichi]XP_055944754.1 protein zer-1 homolog [Argiope bruennichi]
MAEFPTVWVENSADSLLDIAIRFCVKNPRAFCQYNPREGGYELREGLSLPEEICERMLAVCKIELKEGDFESLIKLFKDTNRTRLRQVDLSNSRVTDKTLEILANHKITELDISGCKQLTQAALDSIAKLWDGLQSLIIGSSSHIFEERTSKTSEIQDDHLLHHCMGLLYGNVEDNVLIHSEPQTPTYLQLPLLRKVVIHDVPKSEQNLCFMSLMKSAQYLTYLDLSKCELNANEMNAIIMSKNLISLILCDVPNIRDLFHAICEIKTLRHLDISNTADHVIMYDSPNATLKRIVKSLENLVSLDISGTNLAGGRTQDRYTLETGLYDDSLTDIPGLASRVNRPLEFLGLLNCAFDACYRHHIPAKRIAGDASEEQILTAGQAYYAREPMIQKVLNDLFQIFRFSTCNNTKLALDVVMEAMRLHLRVKHIQVSGSASLFYIVKGEHKELFNIKMRRKIIKLLIDAMFLHYSDVTMLRNGCLTLIHFKIPDDVFFDYERLAILLLLIVAQDDQDEFVQRIGVYLLNSLACQVDGIEKKLVGDRGAITIMLQVIEKRLQRSVCDEVMETAWSTMWNVTDETPINCARFLEGKGMDLFLGCLEAFPQKPELLRNMMGLLGNVAEVKELRCHLMKDEYLLVFSQLLNSKSDGIEVSYNAAGILSHIASDGPEPWITHNITAVKRDEVLKQMVEAIEKWNLDTKRNINYRSFKPILRLLTVEHTPEAQHWAVWALANLTKVYPEKYCNLLKEEGGIELLQNLLQKPSYSRIHQLAEITINNCVRYQERSTDPAYDDEEDDEDALDVT